MEVKPGPGGVAVGPGGGAAEGVLASFFNSLLSKKTVQGGPGGPGGSPGGPPGAQIKSPVPGEDCEYCHFLTSILFSLKPI